MPMPKSLKWIGIGLIAVIILGGGARLIVELSARKALNRELELLRSSGESLEQLDGAPPLVADAQNAAPVYRMAFAARVDVNGDQSNAADDIRQPVPVDPAASVATLEPFFLQNENALALCRHAAQLESCRFPLDYWGNYWAMDLSHLAPMRSLAKILAARACVNARAGKLPEALNDLWIIFRMSRHLGSEPVAISYLVHVAIGGIGFQALDAMAPSLASAGEADLRRVMDELFWLAANDDPVPALRMERAAAARLHVAAMGGAQDMGVVALEGQGRGDEIPSDMKKTIVVRRIANVFVPVYRRDYTETLRFYRTVFELSKKPYHDAAAEIEQLDRAMAKLPPYCYFSMMLLPAMGSFIKTHEKFVSRANARGLALAVLLYERKNGALPKSLTDLSPDFIRTLPVDGFSVKGFVYKPGANDFVVYSLGLNMVDDGGMPEDWSQEMKGDISSRMPVGGQGK
jgi:hypothetical protein